MITLAYTQTHTADVRPVSHTSGRTPSLHPFQPHSRHVATFSSAPLLFSSLPSWLLGLPSLLSQLLTPCSVFPAFFHLFFFLLPPSLTASRTNWEDFQSEQCPFQSIRNMVCKDEDIQSYVGVHVKKKSSTESTQKVRQRKRTTLKRCTLLQDF